MASLARPQRTIATEARVNAYEQNIPLPLGDSGKSGLIERNQNQNSKEVRHIVRDRLVETIKSAIGREIVQRNRKPIDPRLDDLKFPNLYKWTFSPEYPSFPEGGIGRWSLAAHEACLHAVNQGWLSVLPLPGGANDDVPRERVDMNDSSKDQKRPNFTSESLIKEGNLRYNIDEYGGNVVEQIEVSDELPSLRESCSEIDDLIWREEAASRKADELLETHRTHLLGIRKNIIEPAILKIRTLESAAKENTFRYQQLQTRYEELQKEFVQLSTERLALEQRLDHHLGDLDQERRLGELEDLKTAIQDLRDERDAQFQRHLIQLRKARDESRQEGFRKGEASAMGKSSSATIIADLKRQLEESKAKHAIEVSRAREEGRREDEVLNHLLEGCNLLYKGRKRREIRTIYNNWKNIPQNILPKLMLPDGVSLGDKTLILLARLSRVEHDPQKVTALLKRVVELRNAELSVARREPMITNADIEKVLASFGEEGSSRPNFELSSTPRTKSSRDMRSVGNLSPCPNRHCRTGSSTDGIYNISGATPYFQGPESDNSTHSVNLKKLPMSQLINPKLPHSTAISEIENEGSMEILAQPSALENQSQTITEQIDPASSTNLTIHEEIDALRVPRNSLVPSSLQDFPMEFVKDSIRGDHSTFAKCGRAMLDKQLVAWPEMIKLNQEIHPLCPSQGTNGALTFVDGRPNVGEIGRTYPTLLREKVGFYKYIGHYKVIKRIIMPTATWKACALDERIGVAGEIDDREWGRTLLTLKGLCTNATDVEEKRIDDILGFFERLEEPYLRIGWTLLQFVSFNQEDYNLLLGALKEWEMEKDIDDDASSVVSILPPRSLAPQSLNRDTTDNIKQLDGLPSPAVLLTNNEAERTSHYRIEPSEAAKTHIKSGNLVAAQSTSPVVLEIESSGQVTSESITDNSNERTSPEHIVQAEDVRWHAHTTKDLPPSPQAGLPLEQQLPEVRTPPVYIKWQVEEDIYGVSPPRRMSNESSKTRRGASIFSSFARAKKRKIHPYVEDVEDNRP